MRIIELLESKESLSQQESLSYTLLISIRKSKKDGTFDKRKNEFLNDLNIINRLLMVSILSDEENTHIKNWVISSEKLLGIK